MNFRAFLLALGIAAVLARSGMEFLLLAVLVCIGMYSWCNDPNI